MTPLISTLLELERGTDTGKICENSGFHLPVFSRIKTESTIPSLCRRIRVSENPYSHIFYAVEHKKKEREAFVFHILKRSLILQICHNKQIASIKQY